MSAPGDRVEPPDAFRSVVESAPDGIVISREAKVVYANPAAARLLGYDGPSQLVGLSMAAFLDPGALTTMRHRLERMRATGESLAPHEYPAVKRDGNTVLAEITSTFVSFEGAPAVLAFVRDVTERSQLRAQLAHADRLASLGMMAAGIAHEINNPLAFVTLATDMLERGAPSGRESGRDLLHNIRTGVRRIASIVRELRSYSRYEEETPRAVDLSAVFESAVSITAHEVRPRAALRRDHAGLPAVLGIPMRLEQVFVNLLVNAAHSLDEGRKDGEIVLSAAVRGADVVVDVIDNGRGIPADLLPRIFEPFVTTKPVGEGVGLGLSICREIVARWGGSIDATSTVGQGTCLRVTLPVADAETARPGGSAEGTSEPPAASTEPESRVRPSASGPRRRILVIDDEPLTVSMAAATLGDSHEVVCETSAVVGLDRILRGPPFDVVLCDLMMPGMSGMDIYESVARDRPGLEQRMIFMTGGAYTQRARAFLDSVPNAKLIKPISAARLTEIVSVE